MTLELAIKNALDGDAILFLGAGASVDATNYNKTNFKVGSQLAHFISENCGAAKEDRLEDAASTFIRIKNQENKDGREELISILKNECSANNLADYHNVLPNVPWQRIYTTNYDDVVETSYQQQGKKIDTYTLTHQSKSSSEVACIHINGYIKNLTSDTLDSEFKLTDASYNTNNFTNNIWGNIFKQDLKTYSSIIFIGFSMRNDLDIKRIIKKFAYSDKCIFVVRKDEAENNINHLKEYGEVYNIGNEGFFKKIEEIKKTYTPKNIKTLENTFLTNFELRMLNDINRKPSDKNVLSYYITGKRVNELYYSKGACYQAVVKRTAVSKIIESIKANHKFYLLHSDIGNGKSEVIHQVKLELPQKYKVYTLVDNNKKIALEVELICSSNQKVVIIIENFFNYKDILEIFENHDINKNIIFILSARTSIYKTRFDEYISYNDPKVYDLNFLDESEIAQLLEIFNEYGFYFKKSINSDKIIRKLCKRRIQSVVLEIFESENIASELKILLEEVKQRKMDDFLIVNLLIKILSLELNFFEVLDLCRESTLNYQFEKNISVNEFIDFKTKKTEFKSPALAVWLMQHRFIYNKAFDILIEMAIKADKDSIVNKKYINFLSNIISYKHLQFLTNNIPIDKESIKKLIYTFYEATKNLTYYKDKYFFWLQYAIACIEMDDLQEAEHKFAAAYAKFKIQYNKYDSTYVPFEIDTHYARLKMLLLLSHDYQYNPSAITEIEEISKLLTPSKRDTDDEFYCYRTLNSYISDIFEKFYINMNTNEQQKLRNIAKNNYRNCKKFNERQTDQGMKNILSQFETNFLKFSFYKAVASEVYTAHVTRKLQYYIKVTFTSNGKICTGQIYISPKQTKLMRKINIGDEIEVHKLDYNSKHKCWNMQLLQF